MDVAYATKVSEGAHQKLLTLQASFRLFAVLSELLLQAEQQHSAQNKTTELAEQIAAYIESEWGLVPNEVDSTDDKEPLRIEQLAEQLGSVPPQSRIHKAYGISPRQYVSMIKLRKAKLLLMDPAFSPLSKYPSSLDIETYPSSANNSNGGRICLQFLIQQLSYQHLRCN